ncbi:hypothetical protein P8452_28386 [Trifolium repens]|nr:hypothetical protein P8452_28386 [Trifolium repens]
MNKTHFGFFFFLLLLASQMVVQIEGWKCRTQSTMFKGICIFSGACNSACHDEGFPRGGKCKGSLRRCFCKNSDCV